MCHTSIAATPKETKQVKLVLLDTLIESRRNVRNHYIRTNRSHNRGLIMQRSLVVYRHRISYRPLVFSQYTHEEECVYQDNTSDKWNIPWYTTKERCITILYHAIENTVANTISATYARCMMGRLDVIPSNIQRLPCILIGCIFYGTV